MNLAVKACVVALAAAACSPFGEDFTFAAGAQTGFKPMTLPQVLVGRWRDPANTARDVWRHPAETLSFFGVESSHAVIEITPGSGWYAEILAPLLHDGHYIAAVMAPDKAANDRLKRYYTQQIAAIERKLSVVPHRPGGSEIRVFDPNQPLFGEPNSADRVLTFRNVHNWRELDTIDAMFQAFFAVLKPGGILGVVEHRASGDVGGGGYVGQNQVIAWARAAGFVLEAASEINANPADTKDYPGGVSSLPPSLSQGVIGRQKYLAIGESDRMTLRFRKP